MNASTAWDAIQKEASNIIREIERLSAPSISYLGSIRGNAGTVSERVGLDQSAHGTIEDGGSGQRPSTIATPSESPEESAACMGCGASGEAGEGGAGGEDSPPIPLAKQLELLLPTIPDAMRLIISDGVMPKGSFPVFGDTILNRLIVGHEEYGDSLFRKTDEELQADLLEELADAVVYAARILSMRRLA